MRTATLTLALVALACSRTPPLVCPPPPPAAPCPVAAVEPPTRAAPVLHHRERRRPRPQRPRSAVKTTAAASSRRRGDRAIPKETSEASADKAEEARGLRVRRDHLDFRVTADRRRPARKVVSIDASGPLDFDVDAPSWVRVGACRRAPCRLSLTVDGRTLALGRSEGHVELRPHDAARSVVLAVVVEVGEEAR
jgi:hypothetical protein